MDFGNTLGAAGFAQAPIPSETALLAQVRQAQERLEAVYAAARIANADYLFRDMDLARERLAGRRQQLEDPGELALEVRSGVVVDLEFANKVIADAELILGTPPAAAPNGPVAPGPGIPTWVLPVAGGGLLLLLLLGARR